MRDIILQGICLTLQLEDVDRVNFTLAKDIISLLVLMLSTLEW
jgi:hypothetical protein